jgi:hypothetical protein
MSFFRFLQPFLARNERKDTMTWKLRSSGKFDVRSFYCALHSSHRTLFLWKLIWGVKAPRRISFFLWTAARGSILTCDNLMRRGHVLAGWCCMCKNHWETGDHLLLHCEAAVLYGVLFSICLGSSGCFRLRCLICYLAGIIGLGDTLPLFGTSFRIA